MRAIKCTFLFLLLFLTMLPAFPAGMRGEQSVGLVLSGGGAKGIAHIGVIKAFEDNGIPIDYVTGTSMGAIVGALYVCGYSPEEMMALLTSPYFGYLSTGRTDPSLEYYFTREPASPRIFSLPVGGSAASDTVFNPQSLINPMPMDFGFTQIFGAYSAQCGGDFSRLMVPFRCVASDVAARRPHVMRSGDLAHSVHASMSFPLIFQPPRIDGTILYDGGIYDNFPVDVMRTDFRPDMILGIDVSTPDSGEPNSYLRQLELLVMEPQDYEVPRNEGMRIHIDLSDFGLLDFPQAEAICQRGYDRAMEMMDSVKARVRARRPEADVAARRAAFKAATPPMRFDAVMVHGGTKGQNAYVRYLFEPRHGRDTIGIETARLAYYRALSSGKFSMLRTTSTYNPLTGLYTLDIATQVKPRFSAGIGGYLTSTTNSFLYLSASYRSFSFSSVNTSLEAWLGQSYMAGMFRGSVFLHTALPSAFFLEAVAQRRRYPQADRFFLHDDESSSVAEHQYYAKTGFAIAAGRSGSLDAGAGFGHLNNTFVGLPDYDDRATGRDAFKMNLGQVFVRYNTSTLDDESYPTTGLQLGAGAAFAGGKTHFHPRTMPQAKDTGLRRTWVQANADVRKYFGLDRKWSLGIEGSAVLSTRPLFDSYYAAVSAAPCFTPTPSSDNSFRAGFRANSYVAAGLVPVFVPRENLTIRFNAYAFAPVRPIVEGEGGTAHYGKTFGTVHFYGELAANYRLPFANVTAYGNYDGARGKFNFGLSLGFNIKAPKFL